MWRIIRITAGVFICLLGIFGCIYSIQVSRAQNLYYSLKYGSLTNAPIDIIESTVDTAYEIYPHNYNLCNQGSRKLLTSFSDAKDDQFNSKMQLANLWCDRGLAANNYYLSLRYRKAELLSFTSANAAADYWEKFVDWQFWSSQNLILLVKYYANAGRLVEATEIISLLEGSDYIKASAILRKAWSKEMSL